LNQTTEDHSSNRTTDESPTEVVIFDFGGVIIQWDRRHLFRKIFDDEARMEWFLTEVCSEEWNQELDRGLPYAAAIAERVDTHPDFADEIRAYWQRWEEMVPDLVEGTSEIVEELRETGVRLCGLTNFSTDTFPLAQAKFPILNTFESIVVSGAEKVIKPDPAIYELAAMRFGIDPAAALFIDDRQDNVEGARSVGMKALHFRGAAELRADLVAHGLLGD